jgi:hypothetical protein
MRRIRSVGFAMLLAGGWTLVAPGRALGQEQKEPKRQRDVIARWEIEASPKRSDYIFDVIRSLRPHFLETPRGVRHGIDGAGPGGRAPMTSGGSTLTEAAVFVDGNRMGGIDVLKGIQAEQVEEVRYFDPSKAEAEFGLTLGAGGAIVVKLYKGKPPEKPTSLE